MNGKPPRDWKPPARRSSEPPAVVKPQQIALLRVVLVDNLAAWRAKMKGWITEVGTKADDVLEASTGEEAIELIAAQEYAVDVVLCEWDDDTVGGAEMVVKLKSNPATTRIAVIAMCGNDPAAIREAKSAGCAEALVKPVNPVSLLQALSAAQRTLKPRGQDTKKRLQAAASQHPQSTKLTSTIASQLRSGGKLGKYRLGALIAAGAFRNRLYWVEQGVVFVRETRGDGTVVEYRATPGRFFGEAAFVGERIAELRAVAETEVIVGWQEQDAVGNTLVKLPILSHYFKTVTIERHRNNVVADIAVEANTGAINGTLESLPFPDLMSMMIATKKTGRLWVDSGGERAELHLYSGAVRHGEVGELQGDEVIYRLCTWAGGRWTFNPVADLEGPQTIQADANFLLVEGLRRRDAGVR